MFSLVKKGDLCYYKLDSFEESGIAKKAFTTKHGGVSGGVYSSMNLRINSDDDFENVKKNYQIIADAMGIDSKRFVLSRQVHKTDIIDVCEEHIGNGLWKENTFQSADALVTNVKNIPLVTFYADCVSVFLLDRKKQVLALVHSGWRGTADRISTLTIEHMKSKYGSCAEDIIVGIGPSVRQCCFEVGEEVAKCFDEKFIDRSKAKPHVDLQGTIIRDLESVGIKRENITDSKMCTVCRNDEFYSHRVMGDKRGTMTAIAMLI